MRKFGFFDNEEFPVLSACLQLLLHRLERSEIFFTRPWLTVFVWWEKIEHRKKLRILISIIPALMEQKIRNNVLF